MTKISWYNFFSIVIFSLTFIFISQFRLSNCLTFKLNDDQVTSSSSDAQNTTNTALSDSNNKNEANLQGNFTPGVNYQDNQQQYQVYYPFQTPVGFPLQPLPLLTGNNQLNQPSAVNMHNELPNMLGQNKQLGTPPLTIQRLDILDKQCDIKFDLCGPNDLSKVLAKNYVDNIKEQYSCICKQIYANIACNVLGQNKDKNKDSIKFDTPDMANINIKLIESDCSAIKKACTFTNNATLNEKNSIKSSFSGLSTALQHHESFLNMGFIQKFQRQMKHKLQSNSHKINNSDIDYTVEQNNRNQKSNIFNNYKNLEDSNTFSTKISNENSSNNAKHVNKKLSKTAVASFLQKEDTQDCKDVKLPGNFLTEENKKYNFVVSGLTDDQKILSLPIDAVYLTKDLPTLKIS